MNLVLSLLACVLVVSQIQVDECQPIADSKTNYINFFFEQLNPSWRQHRARIRPFSNSLGTPTINVRGARDLEKQMKMLAEEIGLYSISKSTSPYVRPECLHVAGTLYCFGKDKSGRKQTISCAASLDVVESKLSEVDQFALGTVLAVKQKAVFQPVFKMNIYGRIQANETWLDATILNENTHKTETFSLHGQDALVAADRGLRVTDQDCWMRMVKYFLEFDNTQELIVNRTVIRGVHYDKFVNTIGVMNIF